jgi:hypothetical protein
VIKVINPDMLATCILIHSKFSPTPTRNVCNWPDLEDFAHNTIQQHGVQDIGYDHGSPEKGIQSKLFSVQGTDHQLGKAAIEFALKLGFKIFSGPPLQIPHAFRSF